ncbi:hypothetical protein FIBSPDRAFT_896845 [Athelia psychrophila]|uniref:Tc1-like transposase DDE domain-containing protein n=1 Tax=Athelia psychrophila TaxID=1759441 RepID=A0A166CXY2_9AGAM|nr:hypothetical protein FIBSPDRAFT_896845 [Fibularhizoctonia sp. CBS 109695]
MDVPALKGVLAIVEPYLTPDIYISELQQELRDVMGAEVSVDMISRLLKRRGFTRKQILVSENYLPEQLVFLDELSCNRNTTKHRWGCAPIAMSMDGILYLNIQNTLYTYETYNDFVDTLLEVMNPFSQHNSILVMDNASIHKSVELQDLIEAQDYVRGESSGEAACDPYEMLWEAIFTTMDSNKAQGWFRDSLALLRVNGELLGMSNKVIHCSGGHANDLGEESDVHIHTIDIDKAMVVEAQHDSVKLCESITNVQIPNELSLVILVNWWWCWGHRGIDPLLAATIAQRKNLTEMIVNLDGGAGTILRLARLLHDIVKCAIGWRAGE